jgi:hypothetical protein
MEGVVDVEFLPPDGPGQVMSGDQGVGIQGVEGEKDAESRKDRGAGEVFAVMAENGGREADRDEAEPEQDGGGVHAKLGESVGLRIEGQAFHRGGHDESQQEQ